MLKVLALFDTTYQYCVTQPAFQYKFYGVKPLNIK